MTSHRFLTIAITTLLLLPIAQSSLADHHGSTCKSSYEQWRLTIANETNFSLEKLDGMMRDTIDKMYGESGEKGSCIFKSNSIGLQDACMSIPGVGPDQSYGLVCQIWINDGKQDAERAIKWCNDWSNVNNLNVGIYDTKSTPNCSKTITQTCGAKEGETCKSVCQNSSPLVFTSDNIASAKLCQLIEQKGVENLPSAFRDTTSCSCAGTPLRNELNRISNPRYPKLNSLKY